MRYQTYNKKPTKYRQKEAKVMKIILICIILIPCSLNALISTFSGKTTNEPQKEETAVLEPPMALQTATGSSLEIIGVPIITAKPDIEMRIMALAYEADFKWPNYLVRLAHCESRLDPKALNTKGNNPSDSYDRGLFQFNSYWQNQISDDCAYDLDCSTKKAMEMINNGKQHLWACNNIILAKK